MRFDSRFLPDSARLRFRLPLITDTAFYLSLTQSADYIRFISDAGLKTKEDAQAYIRDKVLKRFEDFGAGLWIIELKETSVPVGICGLVVREELPCPDLGYALLETFRGQGLASEAGRAVQQFAHQHLKLDRLCAITAPENTRSAHTLKKLGFQHEGQRDLKEIGAVADFFLWHAARDPASA